MNKKEFKYEHLPSSVEQKSKELIGLPPSDGQSAAAEQVEALVKDLVPTDSKFEVVEELHKVFLIGHRRPRIRPRKSLKKTTTTAHIPPNRGKKRMTCAEKRKYGLVRLKKRNKTFEMFIPIHKMWREYAEETLGTKHFLKAISEGKTYPKNVEAVQNKLKKLEFFGSILKVTRSRCSEYIGLEGIVIQETKNTFTIITTDNSVKLVPKLHSEFSFVCKNFGFSVLGNHLHQRPVDKAKQNFKKHCLWL